MSKTVFIQPHRPTKVAPKRQNGNPPSATSKNQLRKQARNPTRLVWDSARRGTIKGGANV